MTTKKTTERVTLKEAIEQGFDTNLENLPTDFVLVLGRFSLYKTHLELIIGSIMNKTGDRVDPKFLWPKIRKDGAKKWKKAMQGIEHPTDKEEALISQLESLTKIHLFDFRNDLTHTCIKAFHNDGRLYGQCYDLSNDGKCLILREGMFSTISALENGTKALECWCNDTLNILDSN